DFGVIPIENSLQGTVRETLDLLIEKNLIIYGEIELRIIQNLITIKSSDLSKIHTIISHPQAFAQTRIWIKTNLPNASLISVNSTAEAVLRVKELNDESHAAIGTEFSSQVYNLKVLSSNIEDTPSNFTRFLIISKRENDYKEGKIKTSVVFVTRHTPGALYRVLKIFADANINLLKIESRPRRRGRWEYIFLMDFEGDKTEEKIIKIFKKMNENVIWYKILGSYPMV
ncbi:MAG: prephenate dehydratase, partial [Candidatus Thorarchaeota archaeon]